MCTNVSGLALLPAKSWYGLVNFEWNDGEWSYKKNLTEAQVLIDDLNGYGHSYKYWSNIRQHRYWEYSWIWTEIM